MCICTNAVYTYGQTSNVGHDSVRFVSLFRGGGFSDFPKPREFSPIHYSLSLCAVSKLSKGKLNILAARSIIQDCVFRIDRRDSFRLFNMHKSDCCRTIYTSLDTVLRIGSHNKC